MGEGEGEGDEDEDKEGEVEFDEFDDWCWISLLVMIGIDLWMKSSI